MHIRDFTHVDDITQTEVFSFAELPWSDMLETEIIPSIQQREKLPHPGMR